MSTVRSSIAVFGLGYVGLPLSLSYSMKGFEVFGIDISEDLVCNLKKGITHHLESYKGNSIENILKESILSGRFIPSITAEKAFESCDKYIVTVGIPSGEDGLNFSYIKSACQTLASGLRPGDTVIIRSTLVPGTTEEMLIPILESSGLKAGTGFYLCYCPERISEGNAFEEFENLEVLIAGINKDSIRKGKETIRLISSFEPKEVSSIKLAETAKVIENLQRDANIAIVHQFADFCRKLGISVFELVDAANTHPRVQLLKPGPGVGGYCIPNALHYLKPKASEIGANICLLELSRYINSHIPHDISDKIIKTFAQKGKTPENSKIAVIGFAMKDFCCDDRQSPILEIIEDLISAGFSVKAYDPQVSTSYPFKAGTLEDCVKDSDAILIAALQDGINYNDISYFKSMMKEEPILFDTRNIIDITEAEAKGFYAIQLL